jgi:glycosyltransferase involved in cell wall biosynthesis
VTFAGARTDVHDLLMAADGFVMSSRTEGMPMAILEAMGAAVPCVSTAVGGIPGLLGGGAGLLVPVAAPAELATAMQRLVDDPALRADLVDRAMQRVVRDFSLDALVTRYLALLGLPAQWQG